MMSKLSRRTFFQGAALAAAGSASALRAQRRATDDKPFKVPSEPANAPIGLGKGIYPGRVAWAHDPKVAKWDSETGNWWDDASTDPLLVDAMVSGTLQSLTGEKSDKVAWDSLFKHSNDTRGLGSGGYRPGDRIAIKLNSNQDREDGWSSGAGMPTPQVVYALVHQLITEAGVPGKDITVYDASRYIGDPIYGRIRANQDPNYQAIRFVVSEPKAGDGRIKAVPDKANPIRFSQTEAGVAYPPQCVTEAKYHINVALSRGHTLMGMTAIAKNLFGSVYFESSGRFTPRSLHGFASRDLPMGSYNALVDLIADKHLGGKTFLNVADNLYVSPTQGGDVIKYETFGDHWCSSLFMSQDPVAMDSVSLDFVRNEPRIEVCRGYPENFLHEAALLGAAPSGTVYDPNQDGKLPESLGVHEHWNNATDKRYSRNLGKREGIELVRWPKGSTA